MGPRSTPDEARVTFDGRPSGYATDCRNGWTTRRDARRVWSRGHEPHSWFDITRDRAKCYATGRVFERGQKPRSCAPLWQESLQAGSRALNGPPGRVRSHSEDAPTALSIHRTTLVHAVNETASPRRASFFDTSDQSSQTTGRLAGLTCSFSSFRASSEISASFAARDYLFFGFLSVTATSSGEELRNF